MEHPWRVQVHHLGGRAHPLGFLRGFLPQHYQPHYRFLRLGQVGEGSGT
uniref:Uncharacterized protein n=1 Tax=Anguilla anguilla TaxID=7936 RepID=A0A0E9R6S6_ANGAN